MTIWELLALTVLAVIALNLLLPHGHTSAILKASGESWAGILKTIGPK